MITDNNAIKNNAEASAKIQRDIESFLASGGTIQKFGVTYPVYQDGQKYHRRYRDRKDLKPADASSTL